MPDPFDLDRFVHAQDFADTYTHALAELRNARKVSHWMWFVFPQIAGLGRSAIAQQFAVRSLDEAKGYLAHGVLGVRLIEASTIVAAQTGRSAAEIFGGVDAMKLRSSMTLFALAAPDEPIFAQVLETFFDGQSDPATLLLVNP